MNLRYNRWVSGSLSIITTWLQLRHMVVYLLDRLFGLQQRQQSFALLCLCKGNPPVNSPHKGPAGTTPLWSQRIVYGVLIIHNWFYVNWWDESTTMLNPFIFSYFYFIPASNHPCDPSHGGYIWIQGQTLYVLHLRSGTQSVSSGLPTEVPMLCHTVDKDCVKSLVRIIKINVEWSPLSTPFAQHFINI